MFVFAVNIFVLVHLMDDCDLFSCPFGCPPWWINSPLLRIITGAYPRYPVEFQLCIARCESKTLASLSSGLGSDHLISVNNALEHLFVPGFRTVAVTTSIVMGGYNSTLTPWRLDIGCQYKCSITGNLQRYAYQIFLALKKTLLVVFSFGVEIMKFKMCFYYLAGSDRLQKWESKA